MKRLSYIALFLFLTSTLFGDYLRVSRSATIKAEPNRDSAVLEKVEAGTFLKLLDEGSQQNGYYHVVTTNPRLKGWIYRTLVRRYKGNIPGITSFKLTYGPVPPDYYSGTENLKGEELKSTLHEIIKDHREFSYGEVWDILKETDIDTLNTSNVVGIYSGFSMNAAHEYDGAKGWNREHVWAKSYGNFGTKEGAGTDIHHIRAEDVSTNSARNNRAFNECDVQYVDDTGNYQGPTASYTSTKSWTWEPRNRVKGDVARMMFYMVVRYEGDDDEPDLELVDSIPDKNNKKPFHGRLTTLLRWNQEDPVDNYERYRNHIIYEKYQHNRNPFIDHPEFVRRIWGN